jgi:DegV family protein with EDD domain
MEVSMAIKIITDSTSDIPLERQEELGIEIVPLRVRFGSEEYIDGVTLTKPQFYKKLAECTELPTTAQINPDQFTEVFKKYLDRGDEVIGIFLSGKLSGTYQSAGIAKDMLGSEKIHIIDSRNVTFGLALLVYGAIKMRDSGCTAQEICDGVESLRQRLRFYVVVDTLKYLKMGGRLSGSSAFLGTVLHIKPIVSVVDGAVAVLEKKKGHKAAMEWIMQNVEREKPDLKHKVLIGGSAAPQYCAMLQEALNARVPGADSEIMEMGAVVGTHGGPGCVGLTYIAEE